MSWKATAPNRALRRQIADRCIERDWGFPVLPLEERNPKERGHSWSLTVALFLLEVGCQMKIILRFWMCSALGVAVVTTALAQVVPPSKLHVVLDTNLFQLPEDRNIPWKPGVRGGIPAYPICNSVTDYGSAGNGLVDDYSAFTNAIAHCTNGGAVWIPAGIYKLSNPIVIQYPKQIVLRGAGTANTLLKSYTTDTAYRGGVNFGYSALRNTKPISSGFTKGSQTLVISGSSGLVVGQYAQIWQNNDPSVVFGSLSTPGTKWQGQMFMITNISGNIITIDRPLYYDYDVLFGPELRAFTSAVSYCGLENLTLEMATNVPTMVENGIMFFVTANCWAKNVVVTNSHHANINVCMSYATEVRETTTQNHQTYDSNARYGIQLVQYSTDCLVENNIVQGNNLCITTQQGATGNVISYNFSDRGFGNGFPTDDGTKGGINSHGDNSNYNLFEGNVVPWIQWDDFWGENNHEFAFRNWLTRYSYYNTANGISRPGTAAIFVDATNYYMTVVGNILGSPRDTGDMSVNRNAWEIGYQRRGSVIPDARSQSTLLQHGNFDFRSNQTQWSDGFGGKIPNSFYLAAKPSWFGSLTWPPIGPDINNSPMITNAPVIPAQARWLKVSY